MSTTRRVAPEYTPRGDGHRPYGRPFNRDLDTDAVQGPLPTACWMWRWAKCPKGYAQYHANGHIRAHRAVYEMFKGTIPSGLQLDHLCRNRACVNPDHLEPVTARENILRGESIQAKNARKTHCASGHEYAGENLYLMPRGGRWCRACNRERRKRYVVRQREKRTEIAKCALELRDYEVEA